MAKKIKSKKEKKEKIKWIVAYLVTATIIAVISITLNYFFGLRVSWGGLYISVGIAIFIWGILADEEYIKNTPQNEIKENVSTRGGSLGIIIFCLCLLFGIEIIFS